jgi:hypothetical protein
MCVRIAPYQPITMYKLANIDSRYFYVVHSNRMYLWKKHSNECVVRKEFIVGESCYLRFGEIVIDGRAKNHETGSYEEGVYVYPAVILRDLVVPVLPGLGSLVFEKLCLELDKPVFIVAGDCVCPGDEGALVLKNVVKTDSVTL